jgi:hypothetical protein
VSPSLLAFAQHQSNPFTGDETTIDRRVYLGTPLAIQIVAPKLQERRLYKSMQIVERVIQGGEKMPKL